MSVLIEMSDGSCVADKSVHPAVQVYVRKELGWGFDAYQIALVGSGLYRACGLRATDGSYQAVLGTSMVGAAKKLAGLSVQPLGDCGGDGEG